MRSHAVILASALVWLIGIDVAEAKLDILVDKATQRMMVIQDGFIRYMWPVSTGRDNMATPNGVYAPQRMERNWFSKEYYDSPMPFAIFFHGGYAIHGSYAIDRLGGPASHGCVRLHPHHAAILFDLVQQEGPNQTTIEITDDGRPPEGPQVPGRESAALRGANPPVLPPRDTVGMGPGPGETLPMPPRDIAGMAPGAYPPVPPRDIAGMAPGAYPPMPPRDIAGIAPGAYPPARPRDIAGVAPGMYPPMRPRDIVGGGPGVNPAMPPRDIVAVAPGAYPPVPKRVRFREGGETPELPPALRSNQPVPAKISLPPSPAQRPVAPRHMLANVRPSASLPGGAGEAAPPRIQNEASEPRAKPRVVEAPKVIEAPKGIEAPKIIMGPKVADGSSSEPAQPPSSPGSFKLLPTSCWSGGASRWQWWSSNERNHCK